MNTMTPILIDVRNEREYMTQRLRDAINIPLSRIHEVEKIEGAWDGREMQLYCATGARSERAKNILKAMGFNAKNIGGIVNNMSLL